MSQMMEMRIKDGGLRRKEKGVKGPKGVCALNAT